MVMCRTNVLVDNQMYVGALLVCVCGGGGGGGRGERGRTVKGADL